MDDGVVEYDYHCDGSDFFDADDDGGDDDDADR